MPEVNATEGAAVPEIILVSRVDTTSSSIGRMLGNSCLTPQRFREYQEVVSQLTLRGEATEPPPPVLVIAHVMPDSAGEFSEFRCALDGLRAGGRRIGLISLVDQAEGAAGEAVAAAIGKCGTGEYRFRIPGDVCLLLAFMSQVGTHWTEAA